MKRLCEMTADELQAARNARMPLYCQRMRRRSPFRPHVMVYSDVEELSAELLAENLSGPAWLGWRRDGEPFVRTYKEIG